MVRSAATSTTSRISSFSELPHLCSVCDRHGRFAPGLRDQPHDAEIDLQKGLRRLEHKLAATRVLASW